MKIKTPQIPKSVILGVVGICLAYLAIVIFYAAAFPLKSTKGDSMRHIDYVYSVYHGKLANPHNYQLLLIDLSERPKYTTYSAGGDGIVRNGVAHSPPLNYAIFALFSGKTLDDGEWKTAVIIMRAVNISIGIICTFVLARAGWVIGGRYKEYFAVATPGFTIMCTSFITVASNVYNDPLVTLLSTSLLVVTITSLKLGPTIKRNSAVVFISALGMLAKATFLPTLFLAMLFLIVAYVIHSKSEDRIKAAMRAAGINLLAVSAALLSSGWFYWRNYQLSGSFTRAFPKFALPDREQNKLTSVLFDPNFWGVIPQQLLGNPNYTIVKWSSLVVFIIALIGFIAMLTKFINSQKTNNNPYSKQNAILFSVVCLVLLSLAGAYAAQLQHRIGWGQLNMRYLLPGSLLALGLFFSVASLAARSFAKYALLSMIALYGIAAVRQVVIWTDYDIDFGGLMSAVSNNGASPHLLWLLILLLVTGLVFVYISITDITNRLYKKGAQS